MYPSRFYRIKIFFLISFLEENLFKKNINFGIKNANFYFTNKLKKNLNFISNIARVPQHF